MPQNLKRRCLETKPDVVPHHVDFDPLRQTVARKVPSVQTHWGCGVDAGLQY